MLTLKDFKPDFRLTRAAFLVMALVQVASVANSATPHSREVTQANQLLYTWQDAEAAKAQNYLPKRGRPDGPDENYDIQIDTKQMAMGTRTHAEMERDAQTYALVQKYYGYQGLDRFHGTFVESGAAFSSGYQWNTQRNGGFAVKVLRDNFLDQAKLNKILNVRFGINIHELDLKDPRTLDGILDFHREAWRRGISLTDSVLFFSGIRAMETKGPDGKVDPTQSYQNNPEFPKYAEKMADFVLGAVFKEQRKFNLENGKLPITDRAPVAHTAVNPVNEPETFAGFNHFWNGGYANWGDPNFMRLYVPTIINIAKANVGIRRAVERAEPGEDVLIFHNEAMTPKEYPSHLGDLQFAVSKLMLGDDQLMNANFDALVTEPIESIRQRLDTAREAGTVNVIDAAIVRYSMIPLNDTAAKVEVAKRSVIKQLRELRDNHLAFTKSTEVRKDGLLVKAGKTAKTDTIVMFDYYQQSEFILPKPVPEMVTELSANHGQRLKEIMMIEGDAEFLKVLQERTAQAEQATGQTLWRNPTDRSSLDFEKLLSQEDAVVLDKLIGLRNEWNLNGRADLVARRTAAGFDPNQLNATDEKRIDTFLNSLVADGGRLLKVALQVSTDAQLLEALKTIGQDGSAGGSSVSVPAGLSLREVLNLSERTILHRAFGLERTRRVGFLPPHYARQTRAEMRKGFYETFVHYVNELGIRVGGIGESGTPYYPWAATVHKQMMLALVAGAKASDFYIVRNDLGPAWGTVGWMNGPMTGNLQTNGRRGEDGIFKLVRTGPLHFEYQLSAWPGSRPWYSQYRDEFAQGIQEAQALMATQIKARAATLLEQRTAKPSPVGPRKRMSCSAVFGG